MSEKSKCAETGKKKWYYLAVFNYVVLLVDLTQKNHRFSVAPMLDWTDRHCRYFLRLLSKETVLYTEMVTTGAIIYGKVCINCPAAWL